MEKRLDDEKEYPKTKIIIIMKKFEVQLPTKTKEQNPLSYSLVHYPSCLRCLQCNKKCHKFLCFHSNYLHMQTVGEHCLVEQQPHPLLLLIGPAKYLSVAPPLFHYHCITRSSLYPTHFKETQGGNLTKQQSYVKTCYSF